MVTPEKFLFQRVLRWDTTIKLPVKIVKSMGIAEKETLEIMQFGDTIVMRKKFHARSHSQIFIHFKVLLEILRYLKLRNLVEEMDPKYHNTFIIEGLPERPERGMGTIRIWNR